MKNLCSGPPLPASSVDFQMTLLLALICFDTCSPIFDTQTLAMTPLSMRGPSTVCVCAQLCVLVMIHSVEPELGQVNMARAASCEIDYTIDKP